ADPPTLSHLEQNGQVVFRYSDPDGNVLPAANPNGSLHNIAGLVNREGNVLGMMPHPERCADPELGGEDGLLLFRSVIAAAGVVDVGEGWAVVFKVESHNHPSAIEPYQGAATGVGGILRDVIAMGARPIALLDSLRFGPAAESRHHFEGVVAGVGGYGNCMG